MPMSFVQRDYAIWFPKKNRFVTVHLRQEHVWFDFHTKFEVRQKRVWNIEIFKQKKAEWLYKLLSVQFESHSISTKNLTELTAKIAFNSFDSSL